MTVVTRIPFQTAMRTAACDLLRDYRAAVGIPLNVYEARPATIRTPHAFVDRMTEVLAYPGDSSVAYRQRTPRAEVLVLHGTFDSKDTVAQRDAFVDGFIDWVTDNVHAADPNTLISLVATEDEPTFVPDWIYPEEARKVYYGTRLILEGYAGG